MTDLNILTQSFKQKYDRFKENCDIALSGREGFYGYDLSTVALRFIAANGAVKQDEVRSYNMLFDFDYTADELLELYRGSGDMLMGEHFDTDFKDAFARLRGISEELAMHYEELLELLGKIICVCDGEITYDEVEEMNTLKALLS